MPSRNNGTWQRLHLKTGHQFFIFYFFPFALGYFGFYDNLNSTKPQWQCSVVSPDPFMLNSSQTLDVRLNCTRILQGKLLY